MIVTALLGEVLIDLRNTDGAVQLSERTWRPIVSSLEPSAAAGDAGTRALLREDVPGDEVRVLAGVSMALGAIGNGDQRTAASRFLASLRRGLVRHDARRFPAFRLATPDDGSLVVEWSLSDRRLGFSFEVQPQQSGWYYAFALRRGGRSDSGSLASVDLDALLDLWFSVPLD